jgi:hypothetical protein
VEAGNGLELRKARTKGHSSPVFSIVHYLNLLDWTASLSAICRLRRTPTALALALEQACGAQAVTESTFLHAVTSTSTRTPPS